MPLLVHGEVDRSGGRHLRPRAGVRRARCSAPLRRALPAAQGRARAHHHARGGAVRRGAPAPNVAATITAHHLLLNRNALFVGGIRPHHYCLPVLKRETHREALVEAATSGNPKFFLGTDSAPHARDTKEAALRLRRHLHRARRARALRRGVRGGRRARQARGLRQRASARSSTACRSTTRTVTLVREEWRVPERLRLRRRRARAAARRRDDSLEARLAHPAFDAVRPWLGIDRSLEALNRLSDDEASQDRKRQAGALRAAGRKGRVLRDQRVRDRPGGDARRTTCTISSTRSPGSPFRAAKARINAHARRRDPARGRRGAAGCATC